MRIVELDPEDVEVLDLRPEKRTPGDTSPRTPGPAHVSNIIRDIENTLLKPGQRRPYDQLSPAEKKRMGNYTAIGWVFEEFIRDALLRACSHMFPAGRYVAPGECSLAGIHGTPDWLDTESWCVEEFKATWRSSRRPLDPDYWHWLVQIKCYCKMLGCTWANLRVFYVNGDYRDSGPQFKHYRITWSKLEIEDNWRMIYGHAKSKGWVR